MNSTCVTYVSDARYLPLVAASLLSMNTFATARVNVAVFLIDVPENVQADMRAFFAGSKLEIAWINLDLESHFSSLGSLRSSIDRIPLSTFGRLVINDQLNGFENHIYLDGDTLLCNDIHAFAPNGVEVFGAVDAGWDMETKKDLFEKNHLPLNKGYFNAGVYILNSGYWRENDMTTQCIALATDANAYLPLADQDVLNLKFGDKCDWFGDNWNFKKERSWTHKDEAPNILHFAGRLRPWDKRDARAPGSVRSLYAGVFETLPASVKTQVTTLELPARELKRSRKANVRKWISREARKECWNPKHDKVLTPLMNKILLDS
ncbi:hypothetical protein OU789_00180 [Halocynthiibacter sp. C4]|uniref:glycosyltransferase family 8 protein n=1 Tax=Halocynthiibacter sp. C4 TaxID=2992758 RepID=UPI00237A5FAB|nr:glycosyltransferase [Halocynthiibacter sp. C4]MDE0588336.1 hypothetical protein [Halocynthiibacter sp. C4]